MRFLTYPELCQHVHDAAQGPNICSVIVWLLVDHLGGHVERSTTSLRQILARREWASEAEINQSNAAVGGKHDVLALDITMDHPSPMHEGDRLARLP